MLGVSVAVAVDSEAIDSTKQRIRALILLVKVLFHFFDYKTRPSLLIPCYFQGVADFIETFNDIVTTESVVGGRFSESRPKSSTSTGFTLSLKSGYFLRLPATANGVSAIGSSNPKRPNFRILNLVSRPPDAFWDFATLTLAIWGVTCQVVQQKFDVVGNSHRTGALRAKERVGHCSFARGAAVRCIGSWATNTRTILIHLPRFAYQESNQERLS